MCLAYKPKNVYIDLRKFRHFENDSADLDCFCNFGSLYDQVNLKMLEETWEKKILQL